MNTAMMNSLQDVPNRVLRVTVDFWLIKLVAKTVSVTAADLLATNLRVCPSLMVQFVELKFSVAAGYPLVKRTHG